MGGQEEDPSREGGEGLALPPGVARQVPGGAVSLFLKNLLFFVIMFRMRKFH